MSQTQDYALVGAGIMSATLGVLIKELIPEASITIYERLDRVAAESSYAWNNAGTGHSAFCELNYSPIREDGSVDISKALKISEQFEMSKQLWAYLRKNNKVQTKSPFINDIDHMSFVWGDENIDFLKKRFEAMTPYAMFDDMKYSEDHNEVKEWIPLMMKGRDSTEEIGVTRMAIGTDVNFGAITRGMIAYLETLDGVDVLCGMHVNDIDRTNDDKWRIEVEDVDSGKESEVNSHFVFIGAGGGALKLLEKSDISEGRGYGGFPVSGQFLKCNNPDVVSQHEAKVYGKAATGSPPMSVPHMDTRMLDGKRSLLFGPNAGFSTKFLKNGSYLDLPLSIEVHNVWPMLSAGAQNIDLTKYLIEQVFQSDEDRFEFLKLYYPEARFEDWELITAGQRVQIIKKDEDAGGKLQFGTEIVSSEDNTLLALFGASPGASTAVSIMLKLLNICHPEKVSGKWKIKLQEIFPSFGQSLIKDGDLLNQVRDYMTEILKLKELYNSKKI